MVLLSRKRLQVLNLSAPASAKAASKARIIKGADCINAKWLSSETTPVLARMEIRARQTPALVPQQTEIPKLVKKLKRTAISNLCRNLPFRIQITNRRPRPFNTHKAQACRKIKKNLPSGQLQLPGRLCGAQTSDNSGQPAVFPYNLRLSFISRGCNPWKDLRSASLPDRW